MKVIIAGGRDFSDYNFLKERCDFVLQNQTEVEIVCGKAKGADELGEQYGIERGFPIKMFPADWSMGKKAGYVRNHQMAEYASDTEHVGGLIAFWDGKSKGTGHMIDLANMFNLKVRIFKY